ncbi:heavy-metal-associated domain-containing protein [Kitasatospora sp. NPDC090091]|uniref:heavy-metal-associated domain-containing protein n=1 Tax=Kitasatospora sp. NPDC090091 TaxID=3364081 RepID=UPI00382BD300
MSCCSSNGTCSTTATVEPAVGVTAVTAVYAVAGMTCGHCEQVVGKAVAGLPGVTAVSVDVRGGLVTVSAEAELDDAALRAAIDDAGYELTGRA